MASVNFAMDTIEDHPRGHRDDDGPLIKHYRVTELIPAKKLPLHRLLKREPAVWAAVQISSGILSIALGIMFAVYFQIQDILLTLFRVPVMSGILFLVAGVFSMLLYRHPALLQTCFHANIFCLTVATIGAVLLCVDLAKHNISKIQHEVEILVLCVTCLDILVSFILVYLIHAERRRDEKK
ncbi:uncharacterized protein si:ch211-269k10.4 [Neoarius graeffei]|uniref:uncharacterized protein si:ch211-269k10.4 n=1 Tax=Neoarius graeffei TaxID=443677 RepID=UPI00298C570A|nr:uncharacterized protein si:ch211-269k10.4 [Neoarius graeffei]XP_060756431.1 uncharacterized protein si:ch211-269k10.4 [Neoarius graeffei]